MERATDTPARPSQKTCNAPADKPTDSNLKACPCSIPCSTSYSSFAHVRNPKRRHALEYEQHLLILKDLYPEYSAGIDEQIAWARAQSQRGKSSDRDRILKALEAQDLTTNEVAEDLEMPYATAYKILKGFLEKGLVSATTRKGGADKPYLVWSLTH